MQANITGEWLWKWYNILVIYGVNIIAVCFSICTILIRFKTKGDFDTKFFFHPFRVMLVIRQEFDQKISLIMTIIKYLQT